MSLHTKLCDATGDDGTCPGCFPNRDRPPVSGEPRHSTSCSNATALDTGHERCQCSCHWEEQNRPILAAIRQANAAMTDRPPISEEPPEQSAEEFWREVGEDAVKSGFWPRPPVSGEPRPPRLVLETVQMERGGTSTRITDEHGRLIAAVGEEDGRRIVATVNDLLDREASTGAALDVERLAEALKAEGFVRGVAGRYGTFNDVYWQQSAEFLVARLAEQEGDR